MSHVIFKWLHLSDIHFSAKPGFNTQRLRSSLPAYLKKSNELYDCMVLSGDFRYAPEGKMGTEEMVQYIGKLLDSAELQRDKIITVPGNHDLERNDYRKIDIKNAKKGYRSTNGFFKDNSLKKLYGAFTFYDNLKKEIGSTKGVISLENNPHSIIDMGSCYLLMLNTALTAYGGEKDKHELLIGCNYVVDLLNEIKTIQKPIIAIGHHSLDWLEDKELNEILLLFNQEKIRLYLCGHEHQFSSKRIGSVVQVTVGCIQDNDSKNVDAAYSIGQLFSDGTVLISFHGWSLKYKQWLEESTPLEYSSYPDLYTFPDNYNIEPEKRRIKKTNNPFTISKVVSNHEGVKYIWEKDSYSVESMTINPKVTEKLDGEKDENTSTYVISTSIGCSLSSKCQYKSCETGKNNDIMMPLSAENIALQCIFMALYDIKYCRNHPEVQNHKREFAFQGQGEPGYHFDAIKEAILMNDIAMQKLNQKVSRYIISTCEIQEMTFLETDCVQDAGDSTIRAFNKAIELLNDVKKEYQKNVKNHLYDE